MQPQAATLLGDAAGLNVARKAAERIALMNGSFLPAPPPPADVENISDEDAVDEIEHAHATLEMIKRRGGLLTAEQERNAIDTESAPVPPSDTVVIVDGAGLAPRPGGN